MLNWLQLDDLIFPRMWRSDTNCARCSLNLIPRDRAYSPRNWTNKTRPPLLSRRAKFYLRRFPTPPRFFCRISNSSCHDAPPIDAYLSSDGFFGLSRADGRLEDGGYTKTRVPPFVSPRRRRLLVAYVLHVINLAFLTRFLFSFSFLSRSTRSRSRCTKV